MSDSIRDQLLGMGFKPAPKPERKPDPRKPGPGGRGQRPAAATEANKPGKPGKPRAERRPSGPARAGRSQEDIDLAKAYAIRAQKEKDERLAAEVQDLREGLEMVEERARTELGMVRQGEIYVQVMPVAPR